MTNGPFIAGAMTGGISEKCVENFSERVYVVHSIQRLFKVPRKSSREVEPVSPDSSLFFGVYSICEQNTSIK